jgi:hypothetical protein
MPLDITVIATKEDGLTYETTYTKAPLSARLNLRVTSTVDTKHNIHAAEVVSVDNLPDATPNTYYIVNHFVKSRCPKRNDLVTPHGSVYEDGRIIGCQSLLL